MSKIKVILITSIAWLLIFSGISYYYSLDKRFMEGTISAKEEIFIRLSKSNIKRVQCTNEFTKNAHKLLEVKALAIFIKNTENHGTEICLYDLKRI